MGSNVIEPIVGQCEVSVSLTAPIPTYSWPPEGWPDIQNIVENDTDDTQLYKCILLLRNDMTYYQHDFPSNCVRIRTSDGAVYDSDVINHTWDASQDINGEYRYLILYLNYRVKIKDYYPISIAYNAAYWEGIDTLSTFFYDCYSLEDIPPIPVVGATSFGLMFAYCYKLSHVPLFDTSQGTDYEYMFRNCESLTEVPDFITNPAANFLGMFRDCSTLRNIPLLDVSGATSLEYLVHYNHSLQTLPDLDTSSITNFSKAFRSLYTIQRLPSLDTSNGTDFTECFRSCYILVQLDFTLPNAFVFHESVDFGSCERIEWASMVEVFNRLPSAIGKTITIDSEVDDRLTDTDRLIATNKGWTISVG